MSKQEQVMFEQGWVKASRAAAKLGVHVVTVHRLTTSGKIKDRDVQLVGKTKYIRMKALSEAHTPEVRAAFNLDDWSDLEKSFSSGEKRRSKKA